MAGNDTVSFRCAAGIHAAERDRALGVEGPDWPAHRPANWEWTGQALRREIRKDHATPPKIPAALEELVLRFPSAPVHGLQRLHEHHVKVGPSENFHTFRLLRSAKENHLAEPVSRIFLMQTGLNERDDMGLYYRLSSQLILEEPTTVCIVRPFPGHLTRFPFQAFAETPLDNYLWDGSHLFRQFMRFMLETQWFLSVIVRRSSFRCASGANLLGERPTASPDSRLEAQSLAVEMHKVWNRLHQASSKMAEAEIPDYQAKRPKLSEPLASSDQFLDVIDALRSVLNLDDFPKLSGDLGNPNEPTGPKLHVLGYSLGGYTAQSIFMSWPFLIDSCASVLGAGALRELAPTGFADPEEWQTVLHSLRYELDDRMMSKHLGVEADFVAGINRDLFAYFKRTFYEVFEQEHRGSIQTRLEAFRDRMLFIVGGDDPVVRPENVLQSGPKGGINLLEIGGLGHFLGGTGKTHSEKQQRAFWLPEMAKLVHRFSNNASAEQDDRRALIWFDEELARPERPQGEWQAKFGPSPDKVKAEGTLQPLSPTELIGIQQDGALPGELFERCLDDLLHRTCLQKDGILFILRNEVPTVFLPPSAVRETAAALYHDDSSIVRFCHGIAARREVIEPSIERICLVLPWNARRIMTQMDLHRAYPSQAESAGGLVARRLAPRAIWGEALKSCYELTQRDGGHESVRRFDGNETLKVHDDYLKEVVEVAREFAGGEHFDHVPSLPDTWVWLSRRLLVSDDEVELDVAGGIRRLISVVPDICASPETMLRAIRADNLRIVGVSRARYNPRFRGRLVVDGSAARKRLIHAALCLSQSQPIADLERESAFA
jgi:pimeloyl-ACP methyl ester carboxylesterase